MKAGRHFPDSVLAKKYLIFKIAPSCRSETEWLTSPVGKSKVCYQRRCLDLCGCSGELKWEEKFDSFWFITEVLFCSHSADWFTKKTFFKVINGISALNSTLLRRNNWLLQNSTECDMIDLIVFPATRTPTQENINNSLKTCLEDLFTFTLDNRWGLLQLEKRNASFYTVMNLWGH